MTREQNIVLTFYLFMTAICSGIACHKFSVFFAVGFGLAFVLKLANSLPKKRPVAFTQDSHGLRAAEPKGDPLVNLTRVIPG